MRIKIKMPNLKGQEIISCDEYYIDLEENYLKVVSKYSCYQWNAGMGLFESEDEKIENLIQESLKINADRKFITVEQIQVIDKSKIGYCEFYKDDDNNAYRIYITSSAICLIYLPIEENSKFIFNQIQNWLYS